MSVPGTGKCPLRTCSILWVNDVCILATDEVLRVIATERLDGSGYSLDHAVGPQDLHKIQVVIH
jgi:hypothetical protein